jgi:hypothetical protein
VIITDGDVAMGIAIRAVFPTSRHVLCVYHLSLNFKTHICSLFANDAVVNKQMLDVFWKIAKETDELSRDTFDAEFNVLVAAVQGLVLDPDSEKWKKRASALIWLESLRERKEKWAYRYTWAQLTLGANSSQVILIISYYFLYIFINLIRIHLYVFIII